MMTMSRGSPPAPTFPWPLDAAAKPSPESEPEASLAGFGVSGTVVRLEEGELVFSQGGPADAVFHVQ